MSKSLVKAFAVNNLLGGINTVSEDNDLAFFSSGNQVVEAECRDAENLLPINRGGLSKVTGFSVFKSTGANPITGLSRYIKSDGTSLFMVATGGKAYKLVGGALTDTTATISSSNWTHFETANDALLIADGTNTLQKWDSTTLTGLSSGAPNILIGTVQSLFYQNRVWVFGNSANPSLVYYSNANDPTAGYSSQFVNCDTNDGQKITGIAKFFVPGKFAPVILVGKERSIGMITGDGSTANPYSFVKITLDYGLPGFRQFAQFGNDVAFFTQTGLSSYTTAVQNNNIITNYLSEKIRNYFTGLPASTLKDAIVWTDARRRRVSVAVTEASFTSPNVIWHWDIQYQCWYRERWTTPNNITASFVDTDGTWYHGDSAGNIMVHDGSGSFNGGAIGCYYKTPFLDFGAPFTKKQIQEAGVTVRGSGNYSLGVTTVLDFGDRYGKSNTIQLNGNAGTWGTGLWGSGFGATNAGYWGAAPITTKRFYPSAYARQIQFQFSQSGVNQPLDFFGLSFKTVYTGQS